MDVYYSLYYLFYRKGTFLKNTTPSAWNNACRVILKLGSGLFLCFFMIFAPAAPLIAQLGSAFFLFMVMLLGQHAFHDNVHTSPPPFRAAIIENYDSEFTVANWQLQDFPGSDLIALLLHTNRLNSSSRLDNYFIVPPSCADLFIISEKSINRSNPQNEKILSYSYYITQPVRAGPFDLLTLM